MAKSFRHSAGFGKRIEYWIIGLMLKEGIDVYIPLVDDDAIDAVVRRADGSFITVQIKADRRTSLKVMRRSLQQFLTNCVKITGLYSTLKEWIRYGL